MVDLIRFVVSRVFVFRLIILVKFYCYCYMIIIFIFIKIKDRKMVMMSVDWLDDDDVYEVYENEGVVDRKKMRKVKINFLI